MDIYWVRDGRRCGPATVPDVISLVHRGELSPDTLGWHAGCAAWGPLRELPALTDFLTEKNESDTPAAEDPSLPPVPSLTVTEAAGADAPEPELPEGVARVWLPTPAARLLARVVDVSLYMGVVYSAAYVRQLPYSENMLPSSPLFWLGFIAAEAVLLSCFGTTPGKSFFRIRIIAFSEGEAEPLGLLRALGRALMVFVGGMGMMFSFLPVLMCGFSWWTLRRHGITYWDARMSTFPAQTRPTGMLHGVLALLLVVLCLHVVGTCLQPWLPAMTAEIAERSPEAAQWLQQLMPPAAAPRP